MRVFCSRFGWKSDNSGGLGAGRWCSNFRRLNADGALKCAATRPIRKADETWEPEVASAAFDDCGYALAHAYAHGAEGVARFGVLQLIHRGCDEARAAGA